MKIYTKTGDGGETSLHGGKRVGKNILRIEAYGTVDELNSHLGLILAHDPQELLKGHLIQVQNDLFVLGADLATPKVAGGKDVERINPSHVERIEKFIDSTEETLKPLDSFILPGGSVLGAHVHVARTICRRAERLVVALSKAEEVGQATIMYLNRLSDFLFVLARFANSRSGGEETPWHPRA